MDLTIHNGFQDRRFQPLSHLSENLPQLFLEKVEEISNPKGEKSI